MQVLGCDGGKRSPAKGCAKEKCGKFGFSHPCVQRSVLQTGVCSSGEFLREVVAVVVRLDEEFAMMKICKFMCDRNEIGGDCQVATVRWKTDLRFEWENRTIWDEKQLCVW